MSDAEIVGGETGQLGTKLSTDDMDVGIGEIVAGDKARRQRDGERLVYAHVVMVLRNAASVPLVCRGVMESGSRN